MRKLLLNEQTMDELDNILIVKDTDPCTSIVQEPAPKKKKLDIENDDTATLYKNLPPINKALIGKKMMLQALHNSKLKVKSYGKALKKTYQEISDGLSQKADTIAAAFACQKPGHSEVKKIIQDALAKIEKATKHIGLLSKLE